MMHLKLHFTRYCFVVSVLLSNRIQHWVDAQRAEWPRLQIFNDDMTRISREIRSSTAVESSRSHHTTSTSTSTPPPPPPPPSSWSQSFGCPACQLRNQFDRNRDNMHRNHDGQSSTVISAAEKDYRIQVIKRRVLDALGLRDPPVVKGPPPVVTSEIAEQVFGVIGDRGPGLDEEEDEYEDMDLNKTDKQFIFGVAKERVSRENQTTVQLHFSLPRDIPRTSLVTGKLWIHVHNKSSASKRSFVVKQRDSRRYYVTQRVAIHHDDSTGGWLGIDLSSSWTSNQQSIILEIITKSAQQAVNISVRPILELRTPARDTGEARRRVRRGTTCQSNSVNCCRQVFSVVWREINWNWIVLPSSVEVNYCRGSCEPGANLIYNHSSVMHARGMIERNVDLRAQMMPCCTPRRFGNVQVIYRDRNHALVEKVIPNFKVLECGCA